MKVTSKEIRAYLDYIGEDYAAWHNLYKYGGGDSIKDRMIKEFCAGLDFEPGNKFIKIVKDRSVHSFIVKEDGPQWKAGDILKAASWKTSVHSFIVKEDGPKWKAGDILKAASWKAPAQNFKRGNIFDKSTWKGRITWTGAQ